MTIDQRGIPQTLLYGPSGYPQSDAAYEQGSFTFGGVGLRPFSVSLIQGTRDLPAMDVTFTWIRRTRFGGDSWDAQDVPLNEEAELYDLEILSGTTVVRTRYSLTSPTWYYSAAMQITDFGSAQSSYTVNVYQISATYGRGQVATTAVYL
jgi:hypothetical protein